MTNLAIYTNGSISLHSSTLSDEISDGISSGNIHKKKDRKISTKRKETKRKNKNTVIKEKNETIKERTGNLDIYKNMYYHQLKAPAERIKSTFSSAVTRKRKKIDLFSDSACENLILSLKKEKRFQGQKQDN